MRPLVFALPLALLLPMAAAEAQGNSFRRSCTDINQDGSMLSARCRGPGGQYFDTTIDTARCGGQGIANANGRLTCGGVSGSARASGGGYDGPPRPRYGGYNDGDPGYGAPPPPRRYYRQPDDDPYAPPPPPPRRRYDPDQDY